MAEVIRGGLQAIPKGQEEAANALGMNYYLTMGFIVLPQALKIAIPSIVNIFIQLFKDTSLVSLKRQIDDDFYTLSLAYYERFIEPKHFVTTK